MIAAHSHRGRRLLVRLDRGTDLVHSILDLCRHHAVRSAVFRGSGWLEEVELQDYDQQEMQSLSGRRITSPVQMIHLTGSIAEQDGALSCAAQVLLTRESDNGIQALGGQVITAKVFVAEIVIDAFDDLLLRRGVDPQTGISTWVEIIADREAPQGPRSIDREAPQGPRSIDREASQGSRSLDREAPHGPRLLDLGAEQAPAGPTLPSKDPPRPPEPARTTVLPPEQPRNPSHPRAPDPLRGSPTPIRPESSGGHARKEAVRPAEPHVPLAVKEARLAQLKAQQSSGDPPPGPIRSSTSGEQAAPQVAMDDEEALSPPAGEAASPAAADWAAVKAASASKAEEESQQVLPKRGDLVEHATFGRCTIERVEELQERVSVRVRSGRLVQLSLEYLSLEPMGREGGVRVFKAIKRR